jgi:RNA polymerase sigma factor (sigma-70 family)
MEAQLILEVKEAYRKERGRLLGFIRSKGPSEEDAEDILQDVFYSTIENISVTRPIENIVGWLYTAARNKIIDWYRKKRVPAVTLQTDPDAPANSIGEVLAELRFNPEHEYYRNLIIEELTESLEELPAEQKDVFIWNVIEGKTFREIAEFTGESVNTLLSRKRYAVQFLRERLKDINEIINSFS